MNNATYTDPQGRQVDVTVLDQESCRGKLYKVRTPDNREAWVDGSTVDLA